MERPTKEIKTKNGVTAVLHTYITGYENDELIDIYLSEKSKSEVNVLAAKKGTELVVVSINGKTDDVYNTFKLLPLPDVLEIKQHMEAVLSPKVEALP